MEILTDIFNECLNIPIEESEVVDAYAAIQAENQRTGVNLGKNDTWIVATAKRHGLQILTMDADFSRCPSSKYILFDGVTGQVLGRRD